MLEQITQLLNSKLVITVALIITLLVLRVLVVRLIRKQATIVSEQQRRWISHAKNVVFVVILFALIFVWWPEIRQFGLSLAAVAVAFVIAAKELFLCLSGAVMRTTSGVTSIGDWIEVDGIRGEVIEQRMLSTVLQEVDNLTNSYGYTGKTIALPNSVFLSHTVKNMNFMRRFVFHSFSIVTHPRVNVFEAESVILRNMDKYCAEFSELGVRYHAFIVKLSGMALPSPAPTVRVTTSDVGNNIFTVTLFCPTQQAICLEHDITKDFFSFYYGKLAVPSASADRRND